MCRWEVVLLAFLSGARALTFLETAHGLEQFRGDVVALGDFDSDGAVDVLLLPRGQDKAVVYTNTLSSFTPSDMSVSIPREAEQFFCSVTDLNGDGRPDLVLQVKKEDRWYIDQVCFPECQKYSLPGSRVPYAVVSDSLLRASFLSDSLQLHNTGNHDDRRVADSRPLFEHEETPFNDLCDTISFVQADLDNDGSAEVATLHCSRQDEYSLRLSQQASQQHHQQQQWSTLALFSLPRLPVVLRVGDFTGDGGLDLLVVDTEETHVYRYTGGTIEHIARLPDIRSDVLTCDSALDKRLCRPTQPRVADIDSDGRSDIVLKQADRWTVLLAPDWRPLSLREAASTTLLTPIDANNDGVVDLLRQHSDGTVDLLRQSSRPDALFLKVALASDACARYCDKAVFGTEFPQPRPVSPSVPGVTARIAWYSSQGKQKRAACAAVSGATYSSLDLPYCLMGLGRTNNYVDSVTIAAAGEQREWPQVLPNSVLTAHLHPLHESHKWFLQLDLTQSPSLGLTALVCTGVLALIASVLAFLDWKERRKRQRSRLHFR